MDADGGCGAHPSGDHTGGGHADGGDHTDCGEVLERLAFFVDHELAGADTDTIQQHLDECRPCLEKLYLERRLKAMMARCCMEQAPDTLRDRVLVRIRETHVRITGQF